MGSVRGEQVLQKLGFARRCMDDLLSLNGGNLPGASASEKHQLVQEFFFHLIGAVDWTAQLVNEACGLGLDPDQANISIVTDRLPDNHPAKAKLAALYAPTRDKPLPADPYSAEGLTFRAYNYRHQVTHRRANPFRYRLGSGPASSFILDPRATPQVPSQRSVAEDMSQMLALFEAGCRDVLTSIP